MSRIDEPHIPESVVQDFLGALISLSPEGRVLSWSSGAELLFGYSSEEAIGKTIIELVVPPDSVDEARQWLRVTIESGLATYEGVRRRKDGTRVHVEVMQRWVQPPDGGPAFIVANKRDITRLKYLREAEVLEAKFSGLLEAAPDAMVIVDADGRVVLANSRAEQLFDYKREDLLGKHVELLVPERFRTTHPGYRTGYFVSPQPRPMGAGLDLYGRRRDGSEFPAEISLSPMQTESGVLATAAIRDVSERREQYRRIQEANRLKSEFLANMSHELRTPLNAVIGFAEIIHDGRAGPISEEQREYLGDILTSSRHLLQIINDILDLAKIEAGRITLRPERIDLHRLVSEVCDILRTTTAAKSMLVDAEIDDSLVDIVADPARLKQVLYNYLSNALKFTPERGRILVRARADGGSAFRIEVEDNGIGIAAEDVDRLFSEFQQLDSSVAKKFQGTGLGLALTQRIVEAQGGRVGVSSRLGQGSTFYAVLPRVTHAPSALVDRRKATYGR